MQPRDQRDTTAPTGPCGTIRSSARRPIRRFVPQATPRLEERALLSAGVTAIGTERSLESIALARSSKISRWSERRNVLFPTVTGRFDRLDVYLPQTPRPAD